MEAVACTMEAVAPAMEAVAPAMEAALCAMEAALCAMEAVASTMDAAPPAVHRDGFFFAAFALAFLVGVTGSASDVARAATAARFARRLAAAA